MHLLCKDALLVFHEKKLFSLSGLPKVTNDSHHWEANFVDNKYQDMNSLLQMQKCVPISGEEVLVVLLSIVSPLTENIGQWRRFLEPHPDNEFKECILCGLQNGFRIGYQYSLLTQIRSSSHNILSCLDHHSVVESYLSKECALGRLAGPFQKQEISGMHISPFGSHWVMALNSRSFITYGHSTNDGILPEWCSLLSYITVDMIADKIVNLGKNTLLSKLDVKSAFRVIPVHL